VVSLIINGQKLQGEEGETILEVARKSKIDIPALCYHKGLESPGACRLCMVDVTKKEWDGWKKTVASCVFPVQEDLIVETDNKDLAFYRKEILELLVARSPNSQWLREYAKGFGVSVPKYEPEVDRARP